MSITKEEFELRLKEDKFFEDSQEMANYRLPVLQYFVSNYQQHPINLIKILDVKSDIDFRLMNQSFENIKKMFDLNMLK